MDAAKPRLPDRYVARCLSKNDWAVWDRQTRELIFGSVLGERAAEDLAQRLSAAYRQVRAEAVSHRRISFGRLNGIGLRRPISPILTR
jgi:hypothetical protein